MATELSPADSAQQRRAKRRLATEEKAHAYSDDLMDRVYVDGLETHDPDVRRRAAEMMASTARLNSKQQGDENASLATFNITFVNGALNADVMDVPSREIHMQVEDVEMKEGVEAHEAPEPVPEPRLTWDPPTDMAELTKTIDDLLAGAAAVESDE